MDLYFQSVIYGVCDILITVIAARSFKSQLIHFHIWYCNKNSRNMEYSTPLNIPNFNLKSDVNRKMRSQYKDMDVILAILAASLDQVNILWRGNRILKIFSAHSSLCMKH